MLRRDRICVEAWTPWHSRDHNLLLEEAIERAREEGREEERENPETGGREDTDDRDYEPSLSEIAQANEDLRRLFRRPDMIDRLLAFLSGSETPDLKESGDDLQLAVADCRSRPDAWTTASMVPSGRPSSGC